MRKGFSLIELVFAMSFLTIIILGVITLQSSNLAMMNRQNNQIQAHFYANQGIQILRSLPYDATLEACTPTPCVKKLTFLPDTNEYKLSDLGGKNEPVTDTIFERYITIDSTSLTNAYKAIVYIEWEDSTGIHRKTVDGRQVNADVEAKTIIF